MCGIAGVAGVGGVSLPVEVRGKMADSIDHRGPDDRGEFVDDNCTLVSTRLSIIDLAGGHMPISNSRGNLHIVYNGECYNYRELREELVAAGADFQTHSDTEVVLKLYEHYGVDGLQKMNGQYAIAIWDSSERKLFLARDRMGIRPLFYAVRGDRIIFGSEIKAILESGLVEARADMKGIDSLISYACVISPRTFFDGINSLQPGCYMYWENGKTEIKRYWDVSFPRRGEEGRKSEKYYSDKVFDEITKAVKLRLVSDVPVGAYLSGGLDSSCIVERMASLINEDLRTFSITFTNREYDESSHINLMRSHFKQSHMSVDCSNSKIAESFGKLIYHGETPFISTESAALMMLSGIARQKVKVVLTGEGADELMGGYLFDRFEKFRRYLSKFPFFLATPIFKMVFGRKFGDYAKYFFPGKEEIREKEKIFGVYPSRSMEYVFLDIIKHMVYSEDMLERSGSYDKRELVHIDREKVSTMHPFNGSLYLSQRLFLEGHLLASHGDRAAMANSLEGRYPFLDHNIVELFAEIPPSLKMKYSTEKYILRRAFAGRIPQPILDRRKQPFLAPFGIPFLEENAPDMVKEMLTPKALLEKGYFCPKKVEQVISRLKHLDASPEKRMDGQAMRLCREAGERLLLGIAVTFVLSVQMWDEIFIKKGKAI